MIRLLYAARKLSVCEASKRLTITHKQPPRLTTQKPLTIQRKAAQNAVTMMSETIIALAMGDPGTWKKLVMVKCAPPTALEDETTKATEGNSNNDDTEDNAKRNCSPQRSPNKERRKKQQSFMNMEVEEYLETEVREMGLEMAFLDKLDNKRPPTLNKTDPPLQHCVLLGVSVRGIDMEEVR